MLLSAHSDSREGVLVRLQDGGQGLETLVQGAYPLVWVLLGSAVDIAGVGVEVVRGRGSSLDALACRVVEDGLCGLCSHVQSEEYLLGHSRFFVVVVVVVGVVVVVVVGVH